MLQITVNEQGMSVIPIESPALDDSPNVYERWPTDGEARYGIIEPSMPCIADGGADAVDFAERIRLPRWLIRLGEDFAEQRITLTEYNDLFSMMQEFHFSVKEVARESA